MADRLWNDKSLPDDNETEAAMKRQLLSKCNIKANVYELLGGKILPLNNEKFFKRDSYPSAKEVINAVKELTFVERNIFSDKNNVKIIKGCLIALMNTLIY